MMLLTLASVADIDSSGVFGGILSYAVVFMVVGSAFLAFLYLWSKGRLDMDEEPKVQMMQDKENHHDW